MIKTWKKGMMLMQKSYSRINWENYPSDATPINETNLNKIDYAVNEIDNRVIEFDTTKLDVAEANKMVSDVTFDETTGIFTIKRKDGSETKIDTKLEKIVMNWRYDKETQQLILELEDGSEIPVDLSELITQYEFVNGEIIIWSIQPDGTVKADIRNGSITAEKLQPNYLADVTLQAEIATSKAAEAILQKELATMEADKAKSEAEKAAAYSNIVAPDFYLDLETMELYKKGGVGVDFYLEDAQLYWKITA